MARRILILTIVVAWSFPAVAAADWIVSPYIGARFAGRTNFVLGRDGLEENRTSFGSSIGFLTAGVLGLEADLAFVPGAFNGPGVTSSWVTTLMGNVMIAAPLELAQYGLRPYLTGGAGLLRARADHETIGPVISGNLFGMNVGGGAIGPISPRTSLRFDLRHFRNLSGNADADTVARARPSLSYWRGSVGLTFRF